MNKKLIKMWMVTVVTYFEVCPYCTYIREDGLRKTKKNSSQKVRYLDRDSNWVPRDHKV
jgi:hypothetical protein